MASYTVPMYCYRNVCRKVSKIKCLYLTRACQNPTYAVASIRSYMVVRTYEQLFVGSLFQSDIHDSFKLKINKMFTYHFFFFFALWKELQQTRILTNDLTDQLFHLVYMHLSQLTIDISASNKFLSYINKKEQ